MLKVLKTEAEYTSSLHQLENLIKLDPDPGTEEANRIEVLTLLIQAYESKQFPVALPDPVTAIRFRMEQQGLSQNDLVPYIGSRSKVSEVLAKKRSLSLSMIRGLHFGLGIPASALLQTEEGTIPLEDIRWENFPIKEMIARKWITKIDPRRDNVKEHICNFFKQATSTFSMNTVYLKKDHIRSSRRLDHYALAAWSIRILIRAKELKGVHKYQPGSLTMDFLRSVARLSRLPDGPLLASKVLAEHGIALIVERHLPMMFIDGAAMMALSGQPIIGITLRHDRIDNFWFVILHELVHLWRHLRSANQLFYDDLDSETTDRHEREADEVAGEALIPRNEWDRSPAKHLRSPEAAKLLADRLSIHPAIVAGRMRHEAKNYRILTQLIGQGGIRHLFPETD